MPAKAEDFADPDGVEFLLKFEFLVYRIPDEVTVRYLERLLHNF